MWGFITVFVDSLIPRIKELFTLSFFEAGLVQFAFFGAYFLLSIPTSSLIGKIGYQRGIVIGLATMALGCVLFYLAASFRSFGFFMWAYFTIAAGMTLLQVAANPYVTELGSAQGATSRLNLAQAFNSLGTAIAPAIGAVLILSDSIKTESEIEALSSQNKLTYLATEAQTVEAPFLGLAGFIVLVLLVFLFVRLPKIIQNQLSTGSYWQLLSDKKVLLGVLAIFFYVGAEVAIGSYLVGYFMSLSLAESILNNNALSHIASYFLDDNLNSIDPKALVGVFVTFYWSGAMIGRFVGAYLTKLFKPQLVLAAFSLLALTAIYLSVFSTGFLAMFSILAVGLFNSIMFPTIFALTVDGFPQHKSKISGLLCTAIVGGAIVPPVFGFVVDSMGFGAALLTVSLCYIFILYFSYATFQSRIANS